jgi:hypothetical protein
MKCKIIIKLQGHLNEKWKDCFADMERSPDQKSNTALQLIKIPQKNESFVIFKLDMLLIG